VIATMTPSRWMCAAAVLACTAACETPAPTPTLQENQLCELWIAHELREVTDASDRRLAVDVQCDAPPQGQGFIVVTLRLADGEAPLSDQAARSLERSIVNALDASVERRGWRWTYPSLTVEYVR
jgi:hypothetical protein